MAGRLTATAANLAVRQTFLQCRGVLAVQPNRTRYKGVRRGKRHEDAKTFQQRLDEFSAKDPELDHVVNIGFPLRDPERTGEYENRHRLWLKARETVESAARHKQLKLDLAEVKEKWQEEQGPLHVRQITDHYGVYGDLFGTAFFYNTTPLSVCYEYDEEFVTPVYHGNHIPPSEAAMPPLVSYPSDKDCLWTLVMTSPDGDLQRNNKECLHWMIANIPGSDLQNGETLCNYLQPFPVKGVGYLRYVFVLYQQNKRVDFSSLKRSPDCRSLADRTFSTLEFYRQHQEDITPACVSFFQSQWDESVRSVFHDVLGMPEPSYEFIQVPNYHPQQKRYPHKQPFNLYLDRYRDVKDIQEEVLKVRLKRVDPLSPPSPEPQFPNLHPLPGTVPSWLKLKMRHMRLGKHQWKDLNPQP
ncbi:large ribosomal subunit protein mL38-like [Babylonia areolata]|uniref:large ribosomal subunit protein mL38-like n=1 Tax=Babylonia areolata TaxID=304850 RepID=UPI003FCFCC7E